MQPRSLTNTQVYERTSQFILDYNNEAGKQIEPGSYFFLVKHNAKTRQSCADAKLFPDAIGVSEEDFLGAYGRYFKEKLRSMDTYNHNLLGVSSFEGSCTVTILPSVDLYFHNSGSSDKIFRDDRLTRGIARATRRAARESSPATTNLGKAPPPPPPPPNDAAAKQQKSDEDLCTLQKAVSSLGPKETAKLISILLRRNQCMSQELSLLRASVAAEEDAVVETLRQHGAVIDLVGEDTPPTVVTPPNQPIPNANTKKLRRVNVNDQSVTVDRQTFIIRNVPNRLRLVQASRLSFLEKQDLRVSQSAKSISASRYVAQNPLADRLFAAALLAAPGLSLNAAETFIPVVVAGHLAMTGQHDLHGLDFKCFPSQATLRQKLIDYAVDCLILLADKLGGAKLFMTCDKGNKKGLGHFVKVLSWWNALEEKVDKFVLDIDVSDGSSSACADAIYHSLKKLKSTMAVLLRGQTTDSGGGGVLEDLAKELKLRGVCHQTYFVANCTLHAIQLALSNPVKVVFGEGGLDPTTKEPKRNMPQMLHSVYDLQQSMEYAIFKMNYQEAMNWVDAEVARLQEDILPSTGNAAAVAEEGDRQFKEDFRTVWKMARVVVPSSQEDEADEQDKEEKRSVQKFPAPVLTRWFYVGKAAKRFVKDYLYVFKLCQMFINQKDSKATPNVIASCLQSQMMEPTLYSDLVFLYVFHQQWLVPHFVWLQAVDDATGEAGFRSQHILVRSFIMLDDLKRFKLDLAERKLVDFETSLSAPALTHADVLKQRSKANEFLKEAELSIRIHFKRWANELLPLCLGGEFPTARIAANKLLRINRRPDDLPILRLPLDANPTFRSKAHGCNICLPAFREFVEDVSEHTYEMEPLLFDVASRINGGFDMWDNTLSAGAVALRNSFCSNFLCLFSNSQPAEVAVKEAKNVSSTGRQEELRTVMAIGRSAMLPSVKACKTGKEKAKHIVRFVLQQHQQLQQKDKREEDRDDIRSLLTTQHFKKRRLDLTKGTMIAKSHSNKKRNIRQKKRGVVETGRTTGKYQIGLCYKTENLQQMQQEYLFRNLQVLHPLPVGFQAMKDFIKDHERQVYGTEEDYDEKFIRSLSGALFVERKRS